MFQRFPIWDKNDEGTNDLNFCIMIETMDVFTIVSYRESTAFAMLSGRMCK